MKKINLNSVAFLVLGVFLLVTPALSQAIITSLVTAFYRNIDLLVWVNLAQNFWVLNLLPKVVGAALVAGFVWKHLKTRFKCDLPKIKVQTTRLATYSLLFMLCAGLFIFADVPVSDAATTALTGYILDTPVAEYAWLIGAYSDGSFYAIDGSTWDNKVTGVGSTAWAIYRTNSTALTEQVLAACTSGHILLKDVEFDYDLTIPENVAVTERNNGLDRTFINSANSQGSPYTISVDTVQSGYYMAQDSRGRFIDDYSSTNFKVVYDAVSAVLTVSGGSIVLRSGDTFTATAGLNGYSNVNVVSDGATLQVNSDTGGVHALTFADVVNSVWGGVTVERVGTNAGSSHVVYVGGTTDDTTKFLDCVFTNLVTGVASYCHGFYSGGSSAPIVSDCVISGGSGGTYCRGFDSSGSSAPVVSGCTISGGSGGSYCHGFYSFESSAPIVSDCVISGGSGGTKCYGFVSGGSSVSVVSGCTISGGSGGTSCHGFYSFESSAPIVSDCAIEPEKFSTSWSYVSADNGRFQPFTTHPYILRAIYVNVGTATPGVTLDLGTTVNGTEIATGISIATTGNKYFEFTAPIEVDGDAYLYATPSGATADGAFIVYYVVSTNYATCNGVQMDSLGYAVFSSNTVISNGASDAVSITGNGLSYPHWKISNSHLETLDATNQHAVSASGALANASVYNCVLVHKLLNVTPDAGTAQGTNWQDPPVAYEEALPLQNEYVTKLLNLVAEKRLDHTSLYFTSKPLTSLIPVEGLSGKALDDAVLANKNIEAQNAMLVKEAKSLAQIVLERTDKTVEELVPVPEKIAPPIYLDEAPIK